MASFDISHSVSILGGMTPQRSVLYAGELQKYKTAHYTEHTPQTTHTHKSHTREDTHQRRIVYESPMPYKMRAQNRYWRNMPVLCQVYLIPYGQEKSKLRACPNCGEDIDSHSEGKSRNCLIKLSEEK